MKKCISKQDFLDFRNPQGLDEIPFSHLKGPALHCLSSSLFYNNHFHGAWLFLHHRGPGNWLSAPLILSLTSLRYLPSVVWQALVTFLWASATTGKAPQRSHHLPHCLSSKFLPFQFVSLRPVVAQPTQSSPVPALSVSPAPSRGHSFTSSANLISGFHFHLQVDLETPFPSCICLRS